MNSHHSFYTLVLVKIFDRFKNFVQRSEHAWTRAVRRSDAAQAVASTGVGRFNDDAEVKKKLFLHISA